MELDDNPFAVLEVERVCDVDRAFGDRESVCAAEGLCVKWK